MKATIIFAVPPVTGSQLFLTSFWGSQDEIFGAWGEREIYTARKHYSGAKVLVRFSS